MTDAAQPVRPLPELLEALRSHGLRKGTDPGPMVAADPLPTGHASLDAALRSGGWTRGALALLDAPPGAGATSLAPGRSPFGADPSLYRHSGDHGDSLQIRISIHGTGDERRTIIGQCA